MKLSYDLDLPSPPEPSVPSQPRRKRKKSSCSASPALSAVSMVSDSSHTSRRSKRSVSSNCNDIRNDMLDLSSLSLQSLGSSKTDKSRSSSKSQTTLLERKRKARMERAAREAAEKEEKEMETRLKKKKMRELRKNKFEAEKKISSKHTEVFAGFVACQYCGEVLRDSMIEDHYAKHPTQIRLRIWIGNAENSQDVEFMKKACVTHILNCTHEIELRKNVSRRIKMFKRIAIYDKTHENMMRHIKEAILWIDKVMADPSTVVFIHCREGKSRSVSFLCAYLMWKEGISFSGAFSDIRSKRSVVMPNPKFWKQLEEYESILEKDKSLSPNTRRFPPSKYNYTPIKVLTPAAANRTNRSTKKK